MEFAQLLPSPLSFPYKALKWAHYHVPIHFLSVKAYLLGRFDKLISNYLLLLLKLQLCSRSEEFLPHLKAPAFYGHIELILSSFSIFLLLVSNFQLEILLLQVFSLDCLVWLTLLNLFLICHKLYLYLSLDSHSKNPFAFIFNCVCIWFSRSFYWIPSCLLNVPWLTKKSCCLSLLPSWNLVKLDLKISSYLGCF